MNLSLSRSELLDSLPQFEKDYHCHWQQWPVALAQSWSAPDAWCLTLNLRCWSWDVFGFSVERGIKLTKDFVMTNSHPSRFWVVWSLCFLADVRPDYTTQRTDRISTDVWHTKCFMCIKPYRYSPIQSIVRSQMTGWTMSKSHQQSPRVMVSVISLAFNLSCFLKGVAQVIVDPVLQANVHRCYRFFLSNVYETSRG